ncbi:hypothetical protein RvY_18378 [Ramazzottius varieornatus]|uniref:Uncharacterized protein n=1 Tax=Ramazzottius varieornatus TaxID=947166 RepID=A0A1D1WAD0_RAMVA|nr:hypothetical protein RvY_18378 [Ramazzottius varieornatus]
MKYIGVTQKKVDMVHDRARKDGLLWPWTKTVFAESLAIGTIAFFLLSRQRKHSDALAISAAICGIMFDFSSVLGLVMTEMHPEVCERYFTLF